MKKDYTKNWYDADGTAISYKEMRRVHLENSRRLSATYENWDAIVAITKELDERHRRKKELEKDIYFFKEEILQLKTKLSIAKKAQNELITIYSKL